MRRQETSDFERILSWMMLAGVAIAAAVLIVGLVLFLTGRPAEPILTTGLFVLMGTPALRVAVAIVEARRQRDWVFVGATFAVVVLLGLTLFVALQR